MVAIKPPGLKRAQIKQCYVRGIIICGAIQLVVVYAVYCAHLERLSVDLADAAMHKLERQAEEKILRGIGISIPNFEQRQQDMDQALAYVQSFKSLDRTLKFSHLPKNAGTALEDAAGAHQIPWGSCLFPHKPKRDICHYPNDAKDWPIHVGYWHLPRFLFPACDVDPYQRAETFGVVREPYDRMVSEFYYICTLKIFDWRPDQCKRDKLHEKQYMNKWLTRKIQQNSILVGDGETSEQAVHPAIQYLGDNGHFTPQYDFIVGPNQVRYVDFVLTLEHLADSFGELMAAFGLDKLKLKKMNALGAVSRDDAKLTTAHLSPETIQLMHERFEHDFLFGYPMRNVDVNEAEKKGAIEEEEDTEEEVGDDVEEEDGDEAADGNDEEEETTSEVDEEDEKADDQAADDGNARKKDKKQGLRKKKDDEGGSH